MPSAIFSLKEKNEWNSALKNFQEGYKDIYYTPEYYKLYEENLEGEARCFYFKNKYGYVLYPYLINSINKLGYKLDRDYYDIQGAYGYNGCIFSNNSKELKRNFYNDFRKYCNKNNIVTEFTRFHPIIENHKFSLNYMDVKFDRKTIFLNLNQSYEKIFFQEYTSNNRNMIRKGNRLLNIEISNGADSLVLFVKNYLHTMKRIKSQKYYLFSDKYFQGFIKFLREKSYIINVFDKKNKIQNSMILLINGVFAHYHLSGRSSDCTINASNNFMLDEAIKFAQSKNCKFFHLGGGNTSASKDELFKYKSNFSSSNLNFFTGFKIHNNSIYNTICDIWKNKFPKKAVEKKNFNLKYRLVN